MGAPRGTRHARSGDGEGLAAALAGLLPADRVLARPLDRVAHAADASFYHRVPRAVVRPVDVEEVRRLLAFAREHRLPLTFRAAGTSLSGQSVTDGLLVDLGRHWKGLAVEGDASRVRFQPGVIGSRVNAALRPHGRRIGPDPASIDSCMMGGILANNASGMCCGVAENAYHTLESLTCVLPGGLVLDTGAADAAGRLAAGAPEVAQGLAALRDRVRGDRSLAACVRLKYRRKNTTGYSLNAFLDRDEPHRILQQLLVGSEGTLGFIAEAVLRTLPAYPLRLTGLLLFASVHETADAIAPLRNSGARALELMDRASLRSVETQAGAPPELAGLPAKAAALLVEYQCTSEEEMDLARRAAERVLGDLPLLAPPELTDSPAVQAGLWRLRKGLYPSIGAARRRGTAVIIEDVVFPVPRLAAAVRDLHRLFAGHGYGDAIVFGHAGHGNLHFVLTQSFDSIPEIARYERFMAALAELVVERHGGSLKGEHGTGRNVAPFVEAEWGADAYGVMRDLKALLDPDGVLNPGVILNDHPQAHVMDLKSLPVVEPEVDRCIECGFCEPRCPSRRLTLTPRQRIVVRREMARLRERGDVERVRELERDYVYDGLDTCAADGLCATACPVGIDTGKLVKRLRGERASEAARSTGRFLVPRLARVEALVRWGAAWGHRLHGLLGGAWGLPNLAERLLALPSRLGSLLLRRRLPRWHRGIGRPAPRRLPETGAVTAAMTAAEAAAEAESDTGAGTARAPEAVYFPSCLARTLGVPARAALPPGAGRADALPLAEVVVELARRAGVALLLPPDVPGRCCGLPFASKGYPEAACETLGRLVDRLWEWSDGGRLPVVTDAASCAHHLKTAPLESLDGGLPARTRDRWRRLVLWDAVEWLHDRVLPELEPRRLPGPVVLHPNCSTRKMGLEGKLAAVAARCADDVVVPEHLECCASAGDRGLLHPELAASALETERQELAPHRDRPGYSTNPACEMGLTRHTGLPFRSVLYLVEEATRPQGDGGGAAG